MSMWEGVDKQQFHRLSCFLGTFAPCQDLQERLIPPPIESILSLFRRFADDAAFLVAKTKEPTHIAAACIDEDEEGLVLRIASNNHGGVRGDILAFLRKLWNELYLHTYDNDSSEKENFYLELITFSLKRLKCYAKVVRRYLDDIGNKTNDGSEGNAEWAHSDLKSIQKELMVLEETFNDMQLKGSASEIDPTPWAYFVNTAFGLRQNKTLLQSLNEMGMQSFADRIKKAGRYKRAFQTFKSFAAYCIDHGKTLRIEAVPVTGSSFNVIPSTAVEIANDILPNIPEVRKKQLLRKADLFRTRIKLNLEVHAELQLLFFYFLRKDFKPTPYIRCSKRACFLCYLFAVFHGRLNFKSTHKRLYHRWTLPEVDIELEECKCVNSAIKWLDTELRSRVKDWLEEQKLLVRYGSYEPPESTSDVSDSSSQAEEQSCYIF